MLNYDDIRILMIDRNDDIILTTKKIAQSLKTYDMCGKLIFDGKEYNAINNKEVDENLFYITYEEKENSIVYIRNYSDYSKIGIKSWLGTLENDGISFNATYKLLYRLPSSCKITGGTGMEDNPFEITC